jgi:hypothetical protein
MLVLDVPHIWSGWSKNTLIRADEVVITATPELANLRNTKNLVDMLKRLRPNDPPPRLVLNQAGVPKRPEISPTDFSEPLGITPMAVIPFDALLFGNAANNGRMLGEMDAKNAVVQTIRHQGAGLFGADRGDRPVAARQARRRESAREEIRDIVNDIIAIKNFAMSISEQEELLDDICNDVLGYGPLEPLLARDDIADIMVNGAGRPSSKSAARQKTGIRFRDNAAAAEHLPAHRQPGRPPRRRILPICDARLPTARASTSSRRRWRSMARRSPFVSSRRTS